MATRWGPINLGLLSHWDFFQADLTEIQSNPRTMIVRAIAKENKLDIELEETNASTDTFPPNYLELNPLGLVPTFVGADGFTLTEVMAIAIYCK